MTCSCGLLCAAVPPPWYFGVLSSHSRERPEVCPQTPPALGRLKPEPAKGDPLSLEGLFGGGQETKEPRSGRSRWSWLLKRVFRANLETEAPCAGLRSARSEAPLPDCSPSMGSDHRRLPYSGSTNRGRSSLCLSTGERRAGAGLGHTVPARTCVSRAGETLPPPPLVLQSRDFLPK